MRIKCHDCLAPFIITNEEIKNYKKQKLDLPVTCKQCRKLEVIDQRLKRVKKMMAIVTNLIEKLLEKENKNATPAKPRPAKNKSKRLGK